MKNENRDCKKWSSADTIHAKQKFNEEKISDGCSYFFKVLLGDFSQKLSIPPAFVPKLIQEADLITVLHVPSGRQWVVKLCGTSTGLEFGQGWENFVHDQRLELGDFLVFKYICRSKFKVWIFGKSGCEKNSTVFESEETHYDLQKICPNSIIASAVTRNSAQPTDSHLLIDLVSDEEDKNEVAENQGKVPKSSSSSPCCPPKNPMHCHPSLAGEKRNLEKSSAEIETENRSYLGTYYISRRRPVTEAERNKTLKEAKSFKSDKPFSSVLMMPSHVYHGFWMVESGARMKLIRFILFVLWISSQIRLGDCKCAIYSFGDSLADTGNLLISAPGQLIGRFPYGETLGYPTGRCSDGRLIIDFIAEALGQPWLNPFLRNTADFSGGANFAVAGATALSPSFFKRRRIGALFPQFSLDTQVHWFLHYKKVYCSRFKECDKHFANAMFVMGEIGGNDYNYPFSQGRSIAEVQTFIVPVINKIRKALEILIIEGGAKKILIQNNLPIGCSPSYLSVIDDELDDMGCLKYYNEFSQRSNMILKQMVDALQRKHPDVSIVFADYYNAAISILKDPWSNGLQSPVLQTCCGYGGLYNFSPLRMCGVGVGSCPNPQRYFNWDGIHLTEAAYGKIASKFIDGEFTSPPFYSVFKNC
ncbi:hypothetical protein SUGI_0774200 [Cryptomeria japonica]|uniref:GDSL esterase/lipase At5g45910 isoform X1 n=1 Tax=Cryptomeria japonica TaxID=3369 RepID=UPI0024149589|nr:GDSL esterase/lipase At5g45910 isoform X1 [Cryptomeria japonica]GLJ38026.1 hypothetical protein SUGI_0774200 [Cryptomeria japonica]